VLLHEVLPGLSRHRAGLGTPPPLPRIPSLSWDHSLAVSSIRSSAVPADGCLFRSGSGLCSGEVAAAAITTGTWSGSPPGSCCGRRLPLSLTHAVEAYVSLGAAADAARLQAAFREHGIRRGPRAKHRKAQSGWESLTPTEAKVAAFVQEGLSNPEIAARLLLSRRAVATHVSHILKKLGVHSRIDIAREAALRTVASR
jgi:DNA-binding CsgD family transcriptional regulator